MESEEYMNRKSRKQKREAEVSILIITIRHSGNKLKQFFVVIEMVLSGIRYEAQRTCDWQC